MIIMPRMTNPHDKSFMPPSGLITLLTDFGNADGFVAAMKGVMLGIHPRARFIDLTHEIAPQDIATASFLLSAHFKYFPKGTVHVAVVDPGVGTARRALACYWREHYFLAPDNGLLDFCAEDETCAALALTAREYWRREVSNTFHGRDLFAPVAAHLASGVAFHRLGAPLQLIAHNIAPHARIENDTLIGAIIHGDRFGNLISNISQAELENFIGNCSFEIQCHNLSINKLATAYGYARVGELVALINSFNRLELGLVQGHAQQNFEIAVGTPISIKRGS